MARALPEDARRPPRPRSASESIWDQSGTFSLAFLPAALLADGLGTVAIMRRTTHWTSAVAKAVRGWARHNDQRLQANGTTTLFAALNVPDGTVFGRHMQRHRDQEFIRFQSYRV